MDPKVWGRPGWIFLFSVALGFPQKPNFEKIHNYTLFFTYLQYVLPCEICRLHYANHLNQVPINPYVTSRDNLFLWVLKVHNLVNKQLGKAPITRTDVIRIYFNNEISENSFGNDIEGTCVPNSIWETSFWKFMFSVVYGYPRKPTYDDIMNYKNFFTSLQYVLPCINYRKKYYDALLLLPMDAYLTTTEYFLNWIIKMHNALHSNHMSDLYSEDDMIRVYFMTSSSKKTTKSPDNQFATGIGLIEGFGNENDPIQHPVDHYVNNYHNYHGHELISKNLSLAVLVLFTGLVIYKGSS